MSLLLYFLKIRFEFQNSLFQVNRLMEIVKGHPIEILNFQIINRLKTFSEYFENMFFGLCLQNILQIKADF